MIQELPTRRLSLNYRDEGAGDLTLLFMHGWNIDLGYWDAQVEAFRNQYRCIAIDLPGFGNSRIERTEWTIEAMATDIVSFIDELGLHRVVIIGHSMSGELGLETALQAGDRVIGLVGVDNFKFVDMEMPQEVMDAFGNIVSRFHTDYESAVTDMANAFFFHEETTDEVQERIVKAYREADQSVAVPIFMGLLQYSAQVNAKLGQLPFPLHILGNDTPPPFESGLQAHCAKGYALHFVPGTGHYPMIEKPTEFNRELGKIISTIA